MNHLIKILVCYAAVTLLAKGGEGVVIKCGTKVPKEKINAIHGGFKYLYTQARNGTSSGDTKSYMLVRAFAEKKGRSFAWYEDESGTVRGICIGQAEIEDSSKIERIKWISNGSLEVEGGGVRFRKKAKIK